MVSCRPSSGGRGGGGGGGQVMCCRANHQVETRPSSWQQ